MVCLIEQLQSLKGYRLETLYLAVSIADRYLNQLFQRSLQAPNLVTLSVTAIMLAAKLNQSLKPSFNLTVSLLPQSLQTLVSRHSFLELERDILRVLEYDITFYSPVTFLERYLRICEFDDTSKS